MLVAGAVLVRWDSAAIVRDDTIQILDSDTQRRLVRLAAIDGSETYPVVERLDGFPQGSVSHWTLPMDWVVRILDPLARLAFPQARLYEAGAIVSGPLLAACSVALLLLLGRRLLGPASALGAGIFYAFSYSVVNVSWLGNGDHQNLQHLFLLAALLLRLIALEERNRGPWAWLSGSALGFAIWISTESGLMLFLLAGSALVLAVVRREGAASAWSADCQWALALVTTMLLGHLVEHPGEPWAFEADKLSWFQIWQALVFGAFAALGRWLPVASRGKPWIAAGTAVAVGLLPLAVSPTLRATLAEQLDRFAEVNVWLQNEVSEFRSLFSAGTPGFTLAPALARDSWLLLALPLLLPATLLAGNLRRETRLLLVLAGAATFGFEIWEVKLGHMFAIVFPFLLVAGATGFARRYLGAATRSVSGLGPLAFAAVLAFAGLDSLPPRPSETPLPRHHMLWRGISAELAAAARGRSGEAVLAPWEMGAHLMYYAGLPVVASGYHRNLAGIQDGYRILFAGPGELSQATELLRRRKVRWVVAYYNRSMLVTGPPVIGREPLARETPHGRVYTGAAKETLFWRLRYGDATPGFRLLREGPRIEVATGIETLYRIYEFR